MKELRRRQKEIELIVGIDIGQESSQICYYDEQQRQPVSVSLTSVRQAASTIYVEQLYMKLYQPLIVKHLLFSTYFAFSFVLSVL